MNVSAIRDLTYEFLCMSIPTPGSSHHLAALACSDFGAFMEDTNLPPIQLFIGDRPCIAADDAYGDFEVLAVPWPSGGDGNLWRNAWNILQSSSRIHIKRSLGKPVWRWGIFLRLLRMPVSKQPQLIHVAYLLHSMCRRQDTMSLGELDGRNQIHQTGHVNQQTSDPGEPRGRRGRRPPDLCQ